MDDIPFTIDPDNVAKNAKPESKADNNRRNQNLINDSITKFFSEILCSKFFQRIIWMALSLVVLLFGGLILFLFAFVMKENKEMISEVLGIMFKVGSPCIILFLFFIKFGEYKTQ